MGLKDFSVLFMFITETENVLDIYTVFIYVKSVYSFIKPFLMLRHLHISILSGIPRQIFVH